MPIDKLVMELLAAEPLLAPVVLGLPPVPDGGGQGGGEADSQDNDCDGCHGVQIVRCWG